MGARLSLEQCVKGLAEACLRDRSLYETVVRVLMCTVDLEDKLAKRRRERVTVKTRLAIPAPASGTSVDGSQLELPVLIAFEMVEGGVVYIADRSSALLEEARAKGVEEVPAEVYMPPYRLPSTQKLTIERKEPGWITVIGGTPPMISVPVSSEEHVRALIQLIELRGVKPEVR